MTAEVSYIDVACYGRNSSDAQKTSQEIQADVFDLAVIAPWFVGLFGKAGRIVETYRDDGKSASKLKSKRDDFNRMLEDVRSGKRKIVLVVNTSRFSRLHPADSLEFYNVFRRSNACLVSIDDRKIISIDDLGDLISTIVKANADHEYARTVAKNTLRGKLHSIKTKASCQTSKVPYGLAKLVITDTGEERVYPRTVHFSKPKDWDSYLIAGDDKEQDIVRWIFQTYVTDDISIREITRRLNHHHDEQVRQGVNGNGWGEGEVSYILRNRHYAGLEFAGVRSRGEHYRTRVGEAVTAKEHGDNNTPLVVDGKYPPVVDRALFQQAQEKLARNIATGHKPRSLRCEHRCLTGVLVCGQCGKMMTSHDQHRYNCKSGSTCPQWGVDERQLLPWLFGAIDKNLLRQLQDKPVVPTDTTAATRQRINAIDDKVKVLKAKLTAVTTSVDATIAIADALSALATERERLTQEARTDDYHTLLQDAYDTWSVFVEPYLVSIKMDNLGEDNPAIQKLGLQDEVDRLFNFTTAKPETIRQLLHNLSVKVTLFFAPKTMGNRAVKGRQWFVVDKGQVRLSIRGKPVVHPMPAKGDANRPIPETDCCRARPG